AVVGVLIAAAIGYLVARGAARPIRQLAEAAEHVAETQELAARIDVHRTDEVGRLAESFNSMLAALESSREQQRRMVHDAGHELRTPLTAIRTNIELLSRVDNIPDEERKQMIADIDTEIQELSGLVTELVDLAAEPPSSTEVTEEVNLADVVDRVADKFRRRSGNTINVVADESVVLGRTATLERAVSNLIDNAVKWSPADAPIDVTVETGRVSVADRGPGIDEADRPFIFNRFYRATAARSTPGSGLGLSIVAKVAEDHGGQTFVADAGPGAVVGFEIPVLDDEASSPGTLETI
ncbi:MAG: HAMP domain-containing sensor histidine kinase, partial [Acidimicrobiia bacterium]